MDKDKNSINNGPWWKPGVEVFSEISAWIVVPIVLALIAGKALDSHYGTKPKMLLVFAGVGFLVTLFGIVRAARNYAAKLKSPQRRFAEEAENKKI